jgi:protein O-mannosyl-transferase
MKKKIPNPARNKKKSVIAAPKKKDYTYLILGGILVSTLLLFLNSLHNEILNFDDIEYFSNYPEITRLTWENIYKYFTSYYVIMYQPLPILSFALNYYFTGTSTFPLHLVNLCFHLSNIILVYFFIKQLFSKNYIALLIAFLFAIHPMNVEAVSWISARSSSLYTFFYLLSLIFYLRYLNKNLTFKYLLLAALFFIFSLFSKAQAVTLPVILLAIDYYSGRKLFSRRVILEKLPFFLLSITFGIITLMDKGTMINITEGMMVSYSNFDLIFLLCYSFTFYLFKFILPVNLCSIHVYPPKDGGFLPVEYYLSALVILVLAYLLYRFRKNRQVIFGAAVFLFSISINMQIIPSRLFIVSDRYAYFPYIGLFFITGYIINHWKETMPVQYKKFKSLMVFILIAYSVFFSYSLWNRNKIWKNDFTLMSDVIEKNPKVPYMSRAFGNRANYLLKKGKVEQAIQDYTSAIAIKSDDAQSYFNRALAYIKINDNSLALADLDTAAFYEPDKGLIYSNRAFIKYNLNDSAGALADCDKCISLDSSIADAYNTRAALDFKSKNYVKCEYDLNKAISINPEFSDAYKNRGLLYQAIGRIDEACSDWEKASELGQSQSYDLIKQYCK